MDKIERDYRMLAAISQDDADIYGSELLNEELIGMGLSPFEARCDVVRMQVSQSAGEAFLIGNAAEESHDPDQRFDDALYRVLRKRLEAFSEADRPGALLGASLNAARLLGERIEECDALRLSALSAEALEQVCLGRIGRLARSVAREAGVPAERAEGAPAGAAGQGTARLSAAAAAASAYLNHPELRRSPELLGMAAAFGKELARSAEAGPECADNLALALVGVVVVDALLAEPLCLEDDGRGPSAAQALRDIARTANAWVGQLYGSARLIRSAAAVGLGRGLQGMARRIANGAVVCVAAGEPTGNDRYRCGLEQEDEDTEREER